MYVRDRLLASALLIALAVPALADGAATHLHPGSRRPAPRDLLKEALARRPGIEGFGLATPLGSTPGIASTFSACGSWNELSPDAIPFVRDDHAMVYDPVRDRLLIFGGTDGSFSPPKSNEVWALSLGGTPSITQVSTSGTPPDPRMDASMIYDSVRDRLVIFGGIGQSSAFNDVWELTLSGTPTWNQILPAGADPPTLVNHSAIYDATRDRMVVFGGYDQSNGVGQNQVLVLTFTGTPTWTVMAPSGTPPSARSGHTAVYDGPRDRMVVFGGYSWTSGLGLQDAWALSLSGAGAWSLINANGGPPSARSGATAIVDGPRSRMLVFSGFDDNGETLTDTWSLSFTNPIKWTSITPSGPVPVPATTFASVYDPVRVRMISFSADEFWGLGGLAGTPSWSMIVPPGQVPRQRSDAVAIYDSPRQRMVMFGGNVSPEGIWSNDLWAHSLSGGSWTRILPSTRGPASLGTATAIYDPTGDRMIVFGGVTQVSYVNDVWQLTLGGTPAWTLLSPTGTPPSARTDHTAILDAPRNRVIIHGGVDGGGNPLSDVWALNLSGGTSWTQLAPTGSPPPTAYGHTAIFDAPRNRMLRWGGVGQDGTVWALSLAGTPAWSTLTVTGSPPPTPISSHVAAYEPVGDRMLVTMTDSPPVVHSLTLSGTPTWGVIGLTGAAPIYRGYAVSLFDATNDRLVLSCGYYLNDVQALSFPAAFPLNVTASPVAGGTVDVNPANVCWPPGSQVALTATPAANYGFTGWSGDASGTTNPLTVTMDAAKNITANFATYTVTVTVSPPTGGAVARNPSQASYAPGTSVTLTATAATGYVFGSWGGDASGSTNPLTIVVDANKSITANFTGYPVNVTISPSGSGTVTKNPNQAVYAPGSSVTLTASGSFPFQNWSGDASGTTNPLTITVDSPKNITANFQAYSLSAFVAPAGGGTVTVTPFRNPPVYGPGTVTLQALPNAGYLFDQWSGDLAGSTNPTPLLMDANKSVTANFVTPPPACGRWSLVATAIRPGEREGAAGIWDPVRHRMLIFDGQRDFSPMNLYNDLWQLVVASTPAWTQLASAGTAPGARSFSTAVYDPVRDRLILFGGRFAGLSYANDVWALSLGGTPTWTQITPSGTAPQARYWHSMIYDPPRDRLVVFGGSVRGAFSDVPMNDVWALSLAGTPAWTQLAPLGTPPSPRSQHVAIYDPPRDRMVVVGGADESVFWGLSLSGTPAWTSFGAVGTAQAKYFTGAVYDPIRDRMISTGGTLPGGNTTPNSRALTFKNPLLWSPLDRGGPSMGSRQRHTAVYDPDEDAVIVFGGNYQSLYVINDALRFDMSGGLTIDAGGDNGSVLLEPCYDSGGSVPLMAVPAVGYMFDHWLGDASGSANPTALTMDGYKVVEAVFVPRTTAAEESPPPLAFALERIAPNPSAGPIEVSYALPREANVRLGIYDLAGRQVSPLVEGVRPAGRHQTNWDGLAGGKMATSGIYFVRFETPAGSWVRRVALIR